MLLDSEAELVSKCNKAVKAAGLGYGKTRTGATFHTLRHSMASLAANGEMPERVIQEMGNWKDRRMVARYAKFADRAFREAASRLASIVSGDTSHSFTVGASAEEGQERAKKEVTSN